MAKEARKKYLNENKEHIKKVQKEYYKKNIDSIRKKQNERKLEIKKYDRKRQLKVKYNISENEYEQMFNEQNGKCQICKNPEITKTNGTLRKLSVDHCHKTKIVRGLLCINCNTALGKFKDNINLLESAILYLRRYM